MPVHGNMIFKEDTKPHGVNGALYKNKDEQIVKLPGYFRHVAVKPQKNWHGLCLKKFFKIPRKFLENPLANACFSC